MLYQRADTQTFPPLQEAARKKRQQRIANTPRILILGDSITYAGGYVSNFETWLMTQPFGKNKQVLNLGLPSETVSGLSEKGHAGGRFPRPDLHTRLDRILAKIHPKLIFACYGMNCGIYRPVSKERFDAYKAGILKLKTKAEKAGAHIIFITPPYYDDHGKTKPGGFNYADTLATYSSWLVDQRKKGWDVIDLNSEMTRAIHARQVIQPKLTYQGDHIHPNAQGHQIMVQSLINWLSSPNTAPTEQLIRQSELPKGVAPLVNQRMVLLRNAWLTETKHTRPGLKPGLPMDQANKKAEDFTKKINTALSKSSR
jgi:lysophospholipase L1-like esterase